jgi:sugar phosphate isomerase/epimerase
MQRRALLQGLGLVAATAPLRALAAGTAGRTPGTHARLSLNAYSFDAPLRAGTMSVDQLVAFCARHEIEALDLTAYYIEGYPIVPADAELFRVKRVAFVNGVALSGTGVRNDFTLVEASARREQVALVKDWIVAAEKLGVPTLRVFTGAELPPGASRPDAFRRVADCMTECVAFARDHGIVLAVQNHNDFLKTAQETIALVEAVASDWFGVTLDVGSLRSANDPYPEIRRLTPYAVSWQLKELVWQGGQPVPIDLARIKAIVDEVGYRGVLQIETLGEGDPTAKVETYLGAVRAALGLRA